MSLHSLSIRWLWTDDPTTILPLLRPQFSCMYRATSKFSPPLSLRTLEGNSYLWTAVLKRLNTDVTMLLLDALKKNKKVGYSHQSHHVQKSSTWEAYDYHLYNDRRHWKKLSCYNINLNLPMCQRLIGPGTEYGFLCIPWVHLKGVLIGSSVWISERTRCRWTRKPCALIQFFLQHQENYFWFEEWDPLNQIPTHPKTYTYHFVKPINCRIL